VQLGITVIMKQRNHVDADNGAARRAGSKVIAVLCCLGCLVLSPAWGCGDDGAFDAAKSAAPPARKSLRLFVFPNEIEPLGEATIAVETEPCPDCNVCLRSGDADRGRVLGPPGSELEQANGLVVIAADAANTLTSLVYRAPNREGSDVIAASLVRPTSEASPCQGDLIDTTTARVITRKPSAADSEESDAGPAEPVPEPELPDAGDASDAG